jgi:hypothetical protein
MMEFEMIRWRIATDLHFKRYSPHSSTNNALIPGMLKPDV